MSAENPPGNGNPSQNTPVTYSAEQLHAAIEKARMEERQKLRGELDNANGASKPLNDKIVELKSKIDLLTGENDALKKATTASGNVDVKALITEVTNNLSEKFTASAKAERESFTTQLKELSGKLNGYELAKVKDKLISEVGGPDKVIMALIVGNTEEELKSSVQKSHEAYMEIENRVKPQGSADPNATANGQGNNNNPANNAPPIVQPGGQGGAGSGQQSSPLTNVKQMSPQEYKASREKVQQEMRRRHAPAQR